MNRLLRRFFVVLAAAAALAFVPAASALTEQYKMVAPDPAAGAWFGHAVAIDGDTAIVGAPLYDLSGRIDQGAAYIFVRNATSGAWELQQPLYGPAQAGAFFGHSVALRGGTAVVGAPYYDSPDPSSPFRTFTDGGWVSFFVRNTSSGSWDTQRFDQGLQTGAQLGWSVAVSNWTAVVGTPGAGSGIGEAMAFLQTTPGRWAHEDTLHASDGVAGDRFGASVAVDGALVDGAVAIVGAPGADLGSSGNAGAAYAFVHNGPTPTSWTPQPPRLVASDPAAGDEFGYAVALSGDTAIVGAWRDDRDGAIGVDAGSASVWTRSGGTWTHRKQLLGDAPEEALFGLSVALSGNRALVGAYADDVGMNRNQGAAYAFNGSGSNWGAPTKLTASDGRAFDYFGGSVDIDGDRAIAGAFWHDIDFADQGAAYVYNVGGPTAATASAVTGRRSASGVLVRWHSSDPSVLGFRVYRERAGKRLLLTPRLVTARREGRYRYLDRSAPAGQLTYRLQAVRTDGTTTWAGTAQVQRQGGTR